MKRKLLFAVMTLITGAWALSASAQQQDVTATYLTNADFSSGTPIDNHVCTYGKDMATNGTTYYGAQAIDGWTNASVGATDSDYDGCKIAGATYAYGSTPWLGGAGNTAPATDPDGNAGNAAGLESVWEGSIQYTQDVTLPAGSYTIVFKVYNKTTGGGNSSGVITTNLFGFVENGGTTHYAPNNTFAIGQWSTVAVTFELSAETAGKISMGYKGPGGNAAMPHLFVDNVKILKNDYYTDKTSSVNSTGWSGVNDGYQGGTINTARNFNTLTAQRILYQTVSGLDNGTYEVTLYSISQKEWDGSLANDAGNVAYVFAEGLTEQREWMNARARNSYPGDDNIGIYTISGVKVTDGTLTLGMGTALANQTQWHHVQIKSLIYTNGVDLSDYADALALAVSNANALNGLIPTAGYNAIQAVVTEKNQTYTTAEDYQAATAAINTAISTYATDAIKAAYAEYRALKALTDGYTTVDVTADTEAQKATNLAAYNTTVGSISTTVEAVTTDASVITAQTAALKQAGLAFITGLEPANAADAYDVTYMITNPNFDTDTNGWTTTTGAQNKGTATNQPFPNPPMWENWNPDAYTGKMYQTITGLPEGKYEFSMYAFVSTLGDGTNQYVYAGDQKSGITATVPTLYTVTDITVLNGASLEIGFEQTEAVNGWTQIDQATLKYVGPVADLTPYTDAYLAALNAAKATATTTEKIAPSVLTSLNTTITTYDESEVDQRDKTALETATAALVAANTLGQKSIASYAVIEAGSVPDNSIDGWVCENAQTFHINTWSTEGGPNLKGETRDVYDGTNMVTPFIENWTGAGGLLGAGKVYYRLEGLEPGEVYRVSALVRSYNEASADAPNGPNFYVLDDVADLTEVGTTFTYNGMSGIYGTQTAAATIGEDGVLELGVIINENRNYNWVAFKNIQISTFDAALAAAVAQVDAIAEGTVPTSVYTGLQTAKATYNKIWTTPEEYEEAIAALEACAADAAACVEPYAAYLELKPYADALVAAPTDNATAQGTLSTAITTAATDIEAATDATAAAAVNTALRTAMDTYAAAATPTDETQPFNLTYMLTNPDLTKFWDGEPGNADSGTWGVIPEGWASEQEDGNKQVMTNAEVVNGDKAIFYEYWTDSKYPKQNGLFNLYTTVANLPVGTYNMSCYAFAQDQGGTNTAGVYFYANDTQGSQVKNAKLTQQSVEFVNAIKQDVKIGLKPTNTNTYNWMGIGYLELYKIPSSEIVLDPAVPMIAEGTEGYEAGFKGYDYKLAKAGDVTLRRPIKEGYNTLVLPFGMTQAEVKATFGEGSKIFILEKYDSESESLEFTSQEGVLANRPCLLKATQAIAEGTDILIEGRTLVASETGLPSYAVTGATMYGTYAAQTTVPVNSWYVQGGKLVYAEEGASLESWVNMTRAYITLEGWTPDASGAKSLNIIFDDEEATGIATLENGELNIRTGMAYDLSGREVKNPTKGLYIIDGKKVFLK